MPGPVCVSPSMAIRPPANAKLTDLEIPGAVAYGSIPDPDQGPRRFSERDPFAETDPDADSEPASKNSKPASSSHQKASAAAVVAKAAPVAPVTKPALAKPESWQNFSDFEGAPLLHSRFSLDN